MSDAVKPAMHGRDHCPGGSDPIPCLSSSSILSAALYTAAAAGIDTSVPIPPPGGQFYIRFGGLSCNDTAAFKLKGGAAPYTADISAGYYEWLVELDFQFYPQLVPFGTNINNPGDYGQFYSSPTWNGRAVTPHIDIVTITPTATPVPYIAQQKQFSGFMNVNAVTDLEVVVGIGNVQNTGCVITACTLNLVRMGDFLPDESSNVVP